MTEAEEFDRQPTRIRTRRQKLIVALLAILPAVGTSLGASVAAYRAARNEAQAAASAVRQKTEQTSAQAKAATAVVDDKVRAGYQVTRADIEALKTRVARLERALRAAKMPVKTVAPAAPAPLPTTVEKAVEQVKEPK